MRAKPRILLVNGNSSQSVTDRMTRLATAAAPQFEFCPCTPQGGPEYVSTPEDYAVSAGKVVEAIDMAVRQDEPEGCIIACFGEPGLRNARQRFGFPIVGMAEASMLTAMQLSPDFAILTLGEHWPAMLHDLVKLYGVRDRCIAIERIDGTPLQLMADPKQAAQSVIASATKCGSRTIIIGGAALTGLASAMGPLPEMLFVDCLQASIAQVAALTTYRRIIAIRT